MSYSFEDLGTSVATTLPKGKFVSIPVGTRVVIGGESYTVVRQGNTYLNDSVTVDAAGKTTAVVTVTTGNSLMQIQKNVTSPVRNVTMGDTVLQIPVGTQLVATPESPAGVHDYATGTTAVTGVTVAVAMDRLQQQLGVPSTGRYDCPTDAALRRRLRAGPPVYLATFDTAGPVSVLVQLGTLGLDSTTWGKVNEGWVPWKRAGIQCPPEPEESKAGGIFARYWWLIGIAMAGAGFAMIWKSRKK